MQYEYIQFRYKINDMLLPLMQDSINGFAADHIIGYMSKSDIARLEHCSLYMVCKSDFSYNNNVLTEPLGIVAANEDDAIQKYISITGNTNGTIQCELENRCNKIKVLPTGKVIKA